MRRWKLILTGLCAAFSLQQATAQEVVNKKRSRGMTDERYFVLKSDKKVKHGQFLRTHKGLLENEFLMDFGHYNFGKKSGKWLSFYVNQANSLKSIGEYEQDQRSGLWTYYYRASGNLKVPDLFGLRPTTKIVKDKKTDQFTIVMDSSNQKILCTGQYSKDKKTGVWKYYDPGGMLVHSYDHSLNVLVENNESDDEPTYLGGQPRLALCYFDELVQLERQRMDKDSMVSFEVDASGNYKLIRATGNESLKYEAERALKAIPNDWLLLEKIGDNKFVLMIRYKHSEAFGESVYEIEYNLVKRSD